MLEEKPRGYLSAFELTHHCFIHFYHPQKKSFFHLCGVLSNQQEFLFPYLSWDGCRILSFIFFQMTAYKKFGKCKKELENITRNWKYNVTESLTELFYCLFSQTIKKCLGKACLRVWCSAPQSSSLDLPFRPQWTDCRVISTARSRFTP